MVLVRQRPGSANGVVFMTLEDETGIANIVVWPKVMERFRKEVMGARLVLVEGYKREAIPKLEVFRAAVGEALLHPHDSYIVAVASDQPVDTSLRWMSDVRAASKRSGVR